ncbi:MAG: DUF6798 domain-containing protein [Candidatus Acidiferrales bacterium]
MRENHTPSTEGGIHRSWHIHFLAVMGAYANCVAYGFSYGGGNQVFELPLANWLRDPSLYPHDAIRGAYGSFPTIFWPIVAQLSHWITIEHLLLLLFFPTKILFFLAVAGILRRSVGDTVLLACIILSIAVSPFMNDLTPLGASDILDATQTHTSVGIALLLCSAWLLLEERWIAAALICALTVYISALFFIFALFTFAVFAIFDWRPHQREILAAGLIGVVISVPWLLLFRGVSYQHFPNGYVEALAAFYPYLFTLRGHEAYDLLSALGLIVAAALMVLIARKNGQRRDFRFEILTFSSLLPVLLGVILAGIHLSPTIARMQLLRADSFLTLYSILLVQICGANLLGSSARGPATRFLIGATAILIPLSPFAGLLWLNLIGMLLWADPRQRFEEFVRALARSPVVRATALGLLLTGVVLAWSRHAEWSLDVVLSLAILVGCLLVSIPQIPAKTAGVGRVAAVLVGGVCILVGASQARVISRLWNPVLAPTPLESDWRGVQEWAKANTQRDAQFLVPTYPGGFRTFSERSSWGEWNDGQAMFLYPPFADEYRRRMEAVGYSWGNWKGTESMSESYRHLSWERVLELARQNHLSYIIQFREVAYPVAPIFANQHYAVYKVVF